MRPLIAPIAAGALLLSACAPMVVSNGMTVRADWWADVERDIKLRAQIDIGCPAVVVVLQQMHGKFPVLVTAEGCSRKALYQRELRKSMGHSTSRNTFWQLAGATPQVAPFRAATPTPAPVSTPPSPAPVTHMRPATY